MPQIVEAPLPETSLLYYPSKVVGDGARVKRSAGLVAEDQVIKTDWLVPATFLGYPIYSQDEMDDLSDSEGIIAIFGNFSQGYRILDRKGITVQRLEELYIEAGLIGFRLHARVGGYCVRPANKALVLLKEHSA